MRRSSGLVLAWALVLLPLLCCGVTVASEDLVTDRPDQTESAKVVPKGRGQLELGWTLSHEDESGAELDVLEGPGTLLRLGLSSRWELRLGWGGFIDQELEVGGVELEDDGAADGSLGAKLALRDGGAGGPDVALLFGTSLPTGDDDFTSDRFDPAFRVSVAHGLNDRLGIGYNLGMQWETGRAADGDKTTLSDWIYTLVLGIGVGERAGAFVEVFGSVPASAEGSPSHSLDGGFTWLLRDNVQLDVAAGIGLSDRAPDRFAGIGVSWRFPR